MKITYAETYEEMSRIGADLFCKTIQENPKAVVCIATGGSPRGMYRNIVERCKQQRISTEAITCIKLDEWYRLPMDHPATCEQYIQQEFVLPLRLRNDQVISFDSDTENPEKECRRVGELLKSYAPDLCILGLGTNGHLGLNEPGSYLDLFAHTVTLAKTSQQHSMLANVQVHSGMTLGLKEIFSASHILFLVSGPNKTAAFEAFQSGRLSTENPATLLWLHGNVECVVDNQSLR
ncbi:MAG: 6-phosphogluconolactonase [Sphaerochaeta sp.]|nr:6-phosphogluconolactonase [Sphaerochaeta sp.]